MFKKSRFIEPLYKQHGKRKETLLISLSQQLYHIYWSLWWHCYWHAKSWAADDKYHVLNWDNLTQSIQMQLSQKQKRFPQFLPSFLKYRLNIEPFEKKITLIDFVFPKLRTPKAWLDKSVKRPFSEDRCTRSMVTRPKHCWNMHQSNFIIFFYLCQGNLVVKSRSYWHVKSWDCFLTHWLLMTSILFFIGTI